MEPSDSGVGSLPSCGLSGVLLPATCRGGRHSGRRGCLTDLSPFAFSRSLPNDRFWRVVSDCQQRQCGPLVAGWRRHDRRGGVPLDSDFSAFSMMVRLKPDTTYLMVRLKPDTTY